MPPSASTHLREPEIRRMLAPAAGALPTPASHPASVSTTARVEEKLESGTGIREKGKQRVCSSHVFQRELEMLPGLHLLIQLPEKQFSLCLDATSVIVFGSLQYLVGGI